MIKSHGLAKAANSVIDSRDTSAVRGVLERALRSDRLEIASARFRA